jgi:hypothetical protein
MSAEQDETVTPEEIERFREIIGDDQAVLDLAIDQVLSPVSAGYRMGPLYYASDEKRQMAQIARILRATHDNDPFRVMVFAYWLIGRRPTLDEAFWCMIRGGGGWLPAAMDAALRKGVLIERNRDPNTPTRPRRR